MKNERILFISIPLICSAILSIGCAGDRSVSLKYDPSKVEVFQMPSDNNRRIQLLEFTDKRANKIDPQLIGMLTAAFNLSMGAVYLDVSVSETMHQAMKSELKRNGFLIVEDNKDLIIKGDILTYWVSTKTTALYWDVIAEISILPKIKKIKNDFFIDLGPYKGKAIKRTYINPSEDIIEYILVEATHQLMQRMFSDKEMVQVLVSK